MSFSLIPFLRNQRFSTTTVDYASLAKEEDGKIRRIIVKESRGIFVVLLSSGFMISIFMTFTMPRSAMS
jgi:hypothetical protein